MAKNSGETRVNNPTRPGLRQNTIAFIEKWNNNSTKELQDEYTKYVEEENNEVPQVKGPSLVNNEAVKYYQMTSTINKKLRGLSSSPLSKSQTSTINAVDKLLSQSQLKKGIVVYRGTKDHPYDNNGFISTSTSPIVASDFGKVKAYYIPKGEHALWIGGFEKELLLPRGFNIKKYEL